MVRGGRGAAAAVLDDGGRRARGSLGRTIADRPPRLAVFRIAAVRLCLEFGADVNQVSAEKGFTPLCLTCLMGHVAVARLCFEHGADVDRTTRSGWTSQAIASKESFADMAVWLARVSAVGWTRYLSETRYKLVVLRALVAAGRAQLRAAEDDEQLLDFLFPGPSTKRTTRASMRASGNKAQLPSDLFPLVACYYWGGQSEDCHLGAED